MSPYPQRNSHKRRALAPHGFSLIETVLALGIMSLAITALLGLLPHGLEMSRKAANASAQTRIIDLIQNKLSNNSFASLGLLSADQTLHFDDQGELLDDGHDLTGSVYVARVVADQKNVTLPGSGAIELTLLRFQVQIASTPRPEFDFDSEPVNSYQSVPLLIAPLIP